MKLLKIRSIDIFNLQSKTINAYYKVDKKGENFKKALNRLCISNVDDAIDDGYEFILSVTVFQIHPMHNSNLLSCSCIHNHLIRTGKRGKVRRIKSP